MEYILRRYRGQETQHDCIVFVTASGVVPSIPIWRDSAAEWHHFLPQKYRSHQQWQLPHWLLRSIWCYLYLLAIKVILIELRQLTKNSCVISSTTCLIPMWYRLQLLVILNEWVLNFSDTNRALIIKYLGYWNKSSLKIKY